MKLEVNGSVRDVEADGHIPLLWVLRDLLGLTGMKFGCGMAQCGACTAADERDARGSGPSDAKMGGIDEPATPPIAPAVANAVFALSRSGCARCRGASPERPENDMNRVRHSALPGLAFAAFAGVAACAVAQPPPTPVSPPTDPLAAFETVRTVLQHPRCLNCHPSADSPQQGDAGAVHSQGVVRGTDGRGVAGLACTSCHGKANLPASYGPSQPPGVSTEWRMPTPGVKMVFVGVSGKTLCEQLKDPARNGGKDMAALTEHVAHDPLVLWGWSPGVGRAAVSVPHATFTAAFAAWSGQGAPCPQ